MGSWVLRNPILSASALALGIAAAFVFLFPHESVPADADPTVGYESPPVRPRVAAPLRAVQTAPEPAFRPDSLPGERRAFEEAAKVAWAYVEREYQPATGLVNSVAAYPYATIWDAASGLAALYSANRLGLLPDAEYDRRMRRALTTLREMRFYDGAAFNKNYSTRTGAIAGRDDRDRSTTSRGYGWSSIDIGRLLVWLRIIRTADPRFAPVIDSTVARLEFPRLVRDGYLQGETLGRRGRPFRYVEGRIPYEQYAAAGFALWGHRAEKALDLKENAFPITLMGVPLVADRRGNDHLTSEPFVLAGLEVGWTPEIREVALRLLEVQRERYNRTGRVTIVSEDALPQPPHYFYYYSVNLNGRQFAVSAQNPRARVSARRWVSSKAAFAWHALLPSDYTRRAVERVAPARHPGRGWSSGVYEETGRPTGSLNLNTAAVILEAALFRETGRPLLETAGVPRERRDTAAAPPPR